MTHSARLRPRRRVNRFMTVVLVVVWAALWRAGSPVVLAAGLVVAVGIQLLFPLPVLRLDGKVRPFALLGFLGYVVWQTFRSSIDVSRHVLRLGKEPINAVIEVDLRSSSDLILTIIGIVTSLIPGSVVLEARRSTRTLFIHALGVGDAAGVERERQRTLEAERRLIRAIGLPALSEVSGPDDTARGDRLDGAGPGK